MKILEDNDIPDNLIAHLKQVHKVSMKIVDALEEKGIKVNRNLVSAAALLHDVKKLSGADHIIVGYEYVKSLGYPEVAAVIRKHGLVHLEEIKFFPKTVEERIVFYADKRVKHDKIVSVEERFADIKKRYNRPEVDKEMEITRQIEKDLLDGTEI